MSHSDLCLIYFLAVNFYFFTCVSDTEFRACPVCPDTFKQSQFTVLTTLKTPKKTGWTFNFYLSHLELCCFYTNTPKPHLLAGIAIQELHWSFWTKSVPEGPPTRSQLLVYLYFLLWLCLSHLVIHMQRHTHPTICTISYKKVGKLLHLIMAELALSTRISHAGRFCTRLHQRISEGTSESLCTANLKCDGQEQQR